METIEIIAGIFGIIVGGITIGLVLSIRKQKRDKINRENFVVNYDKLCRKYDLMVVSEDPYCGNQLKALNEKEHVELISQIRERELQDY